MYMSYSACMQEKTIYLLRVNIFIMGLDDTVPNRTVYKRLSKEYEMLENG